MSVTMDLGKVGVLYKGEHDSTQTYERNDIVMSNGSGYIAKQNVPVGVNISNSSYWGTIVVGADTNVFATKAYTASTYATIDEVSALQAAVGSPLVASTVAAMTDTEKVYVYTGSETGYTSGNWYYYNGSAWVSGGTYNSQGVGDGSITTAKLADGAVTDAKLAQSGGVLEEVAELENSTKNVVIERISANLLDPNFLNIGKTVQWNTGEISENANYVAWLWIPVIAGKQIFFSRGNGVGQAPATVCYYGAEKNYLGYININATTGATIPNNAAYICMSLGKAAYNNFADSWMLQYDLITLYRPYYERFSTRLIRNNPFVLSVAHQGYHEKAPNQTLSAYKSAFDYGFGTIECDINFTSDGELICCHNETVYADADNMVINPTLGTSASPYTTAINVQSENLSVLQGYSWGAWRGAEFADETVLLFDDLMAYAKQKMLNVIIDDVYRVANDQTLFEAFTNIIDKYGMASHCYVTSVGNIVSEWNSKAKVIFGVSTYSDITDVSQLLTFMTNNPEAEGWVAMPYAQLTDAVSKELHENGIKIYVYTIDSVDDICSKMLYADAICSNIYTVEDAMAIKGL